LSFALLISVDVAVYAILRLAAHLLYRASPCSTDITGVHNSTASLLCLNIVNPQYSDCSRNFPGWKPCPLISVRHVLAYSPSPREAFLHPQVWRLPLFSSLGRGVCYSVHGGL